MSLLLSVPKAVGGPGSLGFFLTFLVIGALIGSRWPRQRRRVVGAFVLLIVSYIVLALPIVALAIVDALPATSLPDPQAIRRIQTLVVFDGDNRLGRQRRTHQILRQTTPSTVWVLGPEYLVGGVRVALGPGTVLRHDTTTWNTSAQVVHTRQVAGTRSALTTAIIASRIQMPRIAALLDAADRRSILLIPSPLDREPATSERAVFVPSLAALAASREALYEHAALTYYRWRGDLR